MGNKTISGH